MKVCNLVFAGLMTSAFLAQHALAEMLDLAGVDRTVTALSELEGYEGVTNSSGTPAKLTFALSDTWNKVENYAGVLAGNLSVVKNNNGTLVFSAANTYTGGTVINKGKLQADNAQAFGPVNPDLPIQVNADLNGDSITANADYSTAVLINVSPFDYPINCAEWTYHGERSKGTRGSATLYNIAVITGAAATLNGKITGGDVAIHDGKIDKWGNNSTAGGHLTINGEIDVGTGALSLMSRASAFYLKAKVRAGAIYHPTSDDWPTRTEVYSSENVIGLIDCGRHNSAGGFTASGANVMGGAVLVSTSKNFSDSTGTQCSQNFDFGSNDQTIDHPRRHHDKALSAVFTNGAHKITMNGYKTLIMKGSASDENDWLFVGNHHLVWDPTGDYTLLNVSRRHRVSGGTIKVKRGCFAMDENCSFSNVAKIVVLENASVSNMCAFAGSFNAVQDVTLGANAALWVAQNPFASTVTLDLAAGAKLHVPEGVQLTATSVKYDGRFQKVGDHATDAFLVGGGTLKVLTNPGAVEETVVWQGGSGADFSTAANWVDKTASPDFEEGLTTLRFAQAGTANGTATVDVDAHVKGVQFGSVASFSVGSDGTHVLKPGADGISADGHLDASAVDRYEVAAPVAPICDQTWAIGSNVAFTLSGPLQANDAGTQPTVSIEPLTFDELRFVGAETAEAASAATFDGTLRFKRIILPQGGNCWTPQVFATGYEPFGAAATIGLEAGHQNAQALEARQACLTLSNAVISAVIDNPYDAKEYRYGVTLATSASSTNVINGTVANFRRFRLADNSRLVFNADVTIPTSFNTSLLAEFSGSKSAELVFNGRLLYKGTESVPGGLRFEQNGVCSFNAPGTELRYVDSNAWAQWKFGADYAFDNGLTEFRFPSTYSEIDLQGHPQFFGSIANTGSNASYRDNTRFRSSGTPTYLKINQTKELIDFYGCFDASITNLTFCGTGSLTLKTKNAIQQDLVLEGATLGLDADVNLAEKTIAFAGGKLSLANDVEIFKAYYQDERGEMQPLPSGRYTNGDRSPIDSYLMGSGTLRVRKSDIVSGLTIIFR